MQQGHARAIWKALSYIQEHLDEELTLEAIAKAACYSPYHFHRIFRAFTKESLNGYVRRLRMEKAAGRLKYTGDCVTKIALDSGYQTPSSFSRAFQQVMGQPPQKWRFQGRDAYPKIKEKMMLTPEMMEMPEQTVLFVRRVGSYQEVPEKAWNALMDFAKEQCLELSDARRFSIGMDDPKITEEERLRFDACLTAPEEMVEKGEVGRKRLRGGRYAVFLHKGPYESLESTFDAIFEQWYPMHKEEVVDDPCLCEHLNMDLRESHPDELLTKIYVPLRR